MRLNPIGILVCIAYTLIFFVRPGSWCVEWLREDWRAPRAFLVGQIETSWMEIGIVDPSRNLIDGTYFVLMAFAVPLVVLAFLRRGVRPTSAAMHDEDAGHGSMWPSLFFDLGLRRPNALAWRYVVVGVLLSLPFLIWMVREPGVADNYKAWLRSSGGLSIVLFYLAVLFVEHFFLHGVVMTVVWRGGEWPASAYGVERGGAFRWLGFACGGHADAGRATWLSWLGVTRPAVVSILLAGLLFGAVHAGKNPRELLLSFPGGVLCGFIAVRSGSWLTPWFVHLGIGAAATAMMYLV